MGDLPNIDKNEIIIVDPDDGTRELKVNADGSINVLDAGSSLAEQKKIYQVSLDINLASAGEKMMLLLRNPTGSGKTLKLISAYFGMTNTVGSMAILRLYANPTVTADGSAATISPAYIGASPAQGASGMQAYTGPTISANGTQYGSYQINGGTNGGQSYNVPFDQNILLGPNNALLLTGNPDGTNRNILVTLRWAEV